MAMWQHTSGVYVWRSVWRFKSDSPQHSPNTDSFNNHQVIQCSNPDVETSAGEPLISMRPFAVTKCSAWLVSKESPRL